MHHINLNCLTTAAAIALSDYEQAVQGAQERLRADVQRRLAELLTTPHLALVMTNHQVAAAWLCPSADAALLTLRCWYAARLAVLAEDMRLEADGEEPLEAADPATATLEQIGDWYRAGEAGYGVLIAPLTHHSPLMVTQQLTDAIEDVETRWRYNVAIRQAIAAVDAAAQQH